MKESVNQDQQADGENIKENELIQNETKEKIIPPDITREQWFWDQAVPS
jgi:hypothetical protein